MKYPVYVGREGSICRFTYDKDFFNENREKCIELVSFYTLYLFGHQENRDDVIVKTKNHLKKVTLRRCLKLLFHGELHHRIFHLSKEYDNSLMALFKGEPLVTNEIITDFDLHACKVQRKHKEFPCMFDEFKVQVYESEHVLENEYDSDFVIGEQISDWDTDCEPVADATKCYLCNIADCVDQKNFTFKKEKMSEKKKEDLEVVMEEGSDNPKEIIIMNNLIFNFLDYHFDISFKNNKYTVTFNHNAIGGYKHASIWTGAIFEVKHAIPDTLKHYNTTYVNEINIIFTELGNEIIISSEYKAIDVL